MPTEQLLLNILIVATILVLTGFGYILVLCESQWRFHSWISNLHACHVWKNDYLDHYGSHELEEPGLIEHEPVAEEEVGDIEEIFLAEWRAEKAAQSYFNGLESLDEARERLYSPIVFPMLVWQVLVPWGSITIPKPS